MTFFTSASTSSGRTGRPVSLVLARLYLSLDSAAPCSVKLLTGLGSLLRMDSEWFSFNLKAWRVPVDEEHQVLNFQQHDGETGGHESRDAEPLRHLPAQALQQLLQGRH